MTEDEIIAKMVKATKCLAHLSPAEDVHPSALYIATLPLGPGTAELGQKLMAAGLLREEALMARDNARWIDSQPGLKLRMKQIYEEGLARKEVSESEDTSD